MLPKGSRPQHVNQNARDKQLSIYKKHVNSVVIAGGDSSNLSQVLSVGGQKDDTHPQFITLQQIDVRSSGGDFGGHLPKDYTKVSANSSQ